MNIFQPPANLKDFDRSNNAADLRQSWHALMNAIVDFRIGDHPAFYNPVAPPSNNQPTVAAPEWTGLPRTVKRLIPASIAAAAQQVEQAVAMGGTDPMFGRYTPPFFRLNGTSLWPGTFRIQRRRLSTGNSWATQPSGR